MIFPPVPPEGINTKPFRAPNLCLFLFQVGFSPGWEQEPEPGVVFGVFFFGVPSFVATQGVSSAARTGVAARGGFFSHHKTFPDFPTSEHSQLHQFPNWD